MRWLFGWKALIIGFVIFSLLAIFVVYYSRDARVILADALQHVTGDSVLPGEVSEDTEGAEEPASEPEPAPEPEPSMPVPDFIGSDELLTTGFEYMTLIGVIGTFFQVVIGLLLKFIAAVRWALSRGV